MLSKLRNTVFTKPAPLSGIPTNIVTGFLGAGKTSTILHLLKNKPAEERWAVLVNEFGEVGVDGAILEGQYPQSKGVYVREVPGGCMCCTAGLPMRVALSQLLRQAKPDRLLIEPTGLGHPKEVLHTLNEENHRDVLAIQKIITVLDARLLADKRYIEHETFQQQIAIADVIVANKRDLYSQQDRATLKSYLLTHSLTEAELVFAHQGSIEFSLLAGQRTGVTDHSVDGLRRVAENGQRMAEHAHLCDDTSLPSCGYVKAMNRGEGFVSNGWRFDSRFVFDHHKMFALLNGSSVQRLKATLITNAGFFAYNYSNGVLSEVRLAPFDESRIEMIGHKLDQSWELDLFNCLIQDLNVSP